MPQPLSAQERMRWNIVGKMMAGLVARTVAESALPAGSSIEQPAEPDFPPESQEPAGLVLAETFTEEEELVPAFAPTIAPPPPPALDQGLTLEDTFADEDEPVVMTPVAAQRDPLPFPVRPLPEPVAEPLIAPPPALASGGPVGKSPVPVAGTAKIGAFFKGVAWTTGGPAQVPAAVSAPLPEPVTPGFQTAPVSPRPGLPTQSTKAFFSGGIPWQGRGTSGSSRPAPATDDQPSLADMISAATGQALATAHTLARRAATTSLDMHGTAGSFFQNLSWKGTVKR